MLHKTSEFYGHKLAATDGDIGHIKDFYFDDKTWVIRYLVADTATWLAGRLILLTPHAFGPWDHEGKALHVKLDKKRVEHSPSIESQKPVSRQYEVEYYRYYGWPAYWEGYGLWGLGGSPQALPPAMVERAAPTKFHHRDDKHLQSMRAVTGYAIHAVDGEIGAVSGFMVDDATWAISQLTVEAGPWYSGKEILITAGDVERISSPDSTVYVNLNKTTIQHTAEHAVAKPAA